MNIIKVEGLACSTTTQVTTEAKELHQIVPFYTITDTDGVPREVWKCESCHQLFDGSEIYREAKVWLKGRYE